MSHTRLIDASRPAHSVAMSTKGDDVKRSARCIAVLAVGGALLLPAGPASAEERVCRGTIGAVTVDNLRVPQEAPCTLEGTLVEGTIKVEQDATLKASGIRVIGNVQAENANTVVVRNGS